MKENSQERFVDENAFLVSKTDLKGVITYCNEPFLQIAAAKPDELLGKPHNIVRHQDVPKIIFKFLWQRIKAKNEIFAYIKNKSLDGKFYWVFANITASLNANGDIIGYYSVRRKPNPKAIPIIEELYTKLKNAENSGGMSASLKILNEFLEEKNLSYDEFINNLQRK